MNRLSVIAALVAAVMLTACAQKRVDTPVVDDVVAANPAPLEQPEHLNTLGEPRFKTNRLIMVETRPGKYVYCRKRRGILICYGGS